ncbi:MAG TPA: DUF1684 domain-containing protein [Vicinamibacterales bacterium]|jgi:hypothetical protein
MHGPSRALILGMTVVALAEAQAIGPARPVRLAKGAAEAVTKALQKDRADTEKWLSSDVTSYLATIERRDFGDKKTLTVGRAAGNDVRIDAPGISPHHVRVTVVGDRFHIEGIDQQARFRLKADEKIERRDATVDPSYIQIDRFTLRLSHQRFPAIIVFDPQSPRFKEYKGLRYFPVDLTYRYELPLTPNPKPETMMIMSTVGNQRRAQRVGWFDFVVGQTVSRLEAVRLLEPGVGENDLSVLFRDATSEHETYPLGRYVDPKKLPNGTYVLDFNEAYNPACAFSDHYNCPIPPKANTLTVAIRAGEMDSHYH